MIPNIKFPQVKVYPTQDLKESVEVCLKSDVEAVIVNLLADNRRMQSRAVEAERKYYELVRKDADKRLCELEDEGIAAGTELEYLVNNINARDFLKRMQG